MKSAKARNLPVRHGAQQAEVLPPEDQSCQDGNFAIHGNFAAAAAQINADYDRWDRNNAECNVLMLRMGLLMEAVIAQLPHGAWGKWREHNIKVSERHSYRFRGVAQKFIVQHKLDFHKAYELSAAPEDSASAKKFGQMAFDFLGRMSQADVFEKYGVVKPIRRGGDHGGGAAMAERAKHRHQLELRNAFEQWQLIIRYLREFALQKKRYVHIPPAMIAEGLKSIRECLAVLPKED